MAAATHGTFSLSWNHPVAALVELAGRTCTLQCGGSRCHAGRPPARRRRSPYRSAAPPIHIDISTCLVLSCTLLTSRCARWSLPPTIILHQLHVIYVRQATVVRLAPAVGRKQATPRIHRPAAAAATGSLRSACLALAASRRRAVSRPQLLLLRTGHCSSLSRPSRKQQTTRCGSSTHTPSPRRVAALPLRRLVPPSQRPLISSDLPAPLDLILRYRWSTSGGMRASWCWAPT